MSGQEGLKPLSQFDVETLFNFKLGGYELPFTNSTLFMVLGLLVVSSVLIACTHNPKLIPNKLQSLGELIHDFVMDTLQANTLGEGAKYFPFIFSLFCFIITLNLLGLVPHGFTVTSHLSVTLALAMVVFITMNIIAFAKHGLKFFSFFLPEGMPIPLVPIMVGIEMFVYLIRPVTLSIRLAANMIAGHVLLYIAASFIVMGGFAFGFIPIPFVIAFSGLEIFVAVLQAYIFTILTCTYLNDAIHLH